MKKGLLILLIFILVFPAARAEIEERKYGNTTWYYVTPGLYEIGEDIPAGSYDMRIESGVLPCDIAFSMTLTEEGVPDLTDPYSYFLTYNSTNWSQGAHPVISTISGGYLLIKWRNCRLYPVPMGY